MESNGLIAEQNAESAPKGWALVRGQREQVAEDLAEESDLDENP